MQFSHLSSNRTGGNGVQVETKYQKFIRRHRAHVPHKTLNLVNSRCCSTECGEEMYQKIITHVQGIFFYSVINAIILDVLVAVAIVIS